MKCKVCGDIDVKGICLCGYCKKCIKLNGHTRCSEIAIDNKLTHKTGESK